LNTLREFGDVDYLVDWDIWARLGG